MARLVTIKKAGKIELPAFSIESSEFCKLLFRTLEPDSDVTILVGDTDLDHTALSGRDDIERNISLVHGILTVRASDFAIYIRPLNGYIQFDELKSSFKALIDDLELRTPWYKKVAQASVRRIVLSAIVFGTIFTLLAIYLFEFTPFGPTTALGEISVLMLMFFASIHFPQKIAAPKVYYRPREGFLGRNRDKIIWSLLSFLCALALTYVWPSFPGKF